MADPPLDPAIPPVRRRKKKKNRSAVRKNWWLLPALVCVVMIGWLATGPQWSRARLIRPVVEPMAGYIANTPTMTKEYLRFYGKPLNNDAVERGFDQANQRVAAKDYTNAAGLLEQVSKVAAVPVVFNNLGVLYAELHDKSRATNAFREALARDVDYRPVRLNLDRMKNLIALGVAEPVSRELEPNDSAMLANLIAPNKPVEAEIAAAGNDVDYFRVTTPPAPRDLISIEITNHSSTLTPVLKIFDSERRVTNWGVSNREPGSKLQQTIGPAPNTPLYLQVSGLGRSAGAYTLLFHPKKAFDAYEPNDDIYNAPRISLSTPLSANIMDASDTDYFSFVSPRTGNVSITITNRSTTLIPALSTFYPDKRSSGFGPDVRTPGLNLRHSMEVQENQTYFLQVWSQSNTAGEYSLIIE